MEIPVSCLMSESKINTFLSKRRLLGDDINDYAYICNDLGSEYSWVSNYMFEVVERNVELNRHNFRTTNDSSMVSNTKYKLSQCDIQEHKETIILPKAINHLKIDGYGDSIKVKIPHTSEDTVIIEHQSYGVNTLNIDVETNSDVNIISDSDTTVSVHNSSKDSVIVAGSNGVYLRNSGNVIRKGSYAICMKTDEDAKIVEDMLNAIGEYMLFEEYYIGHLKEAIALKRMINFYIGNNGIEIEESPIQGYYIDRSFYRTEEFKRLMTSKELYKREFE